MKWFCRRGIALVCLITASAWTKPRPDVGAIYQRLICVVPMVGSGTVKDPIRPMFTPVRSETEQLQSAVPAHGKKRQNPSVIAFQSVPTDDGMAAIVIFVARSYSAFKPILSDSHVIEKFERKDISERDLVEHLRKYKKNFDIQMLRVGAQ